MAEEETRDKIGELINHKPIKQEELKQEQEVKPKPKPKARAKAKPKVKIIKEPVVEEPVEEPIVEPHKKVDKLKEIVKSPDCNMDMTQHTLTYIHKRRGFCKAEKTVTETPVSVCQRSATKAPEPNKTSISEDIVND